MIEATALRRKLPEGLTAGKALAGVAIVAFMAMMLARPDYYLASARKGLTLYATSVLPSLFPFYFCSLLLTNIGAARTVSLLFGKPIKRLYGVPEESAYILLLSMLSGYPVGASMTAELYAAGAISQREAKAISSFCSTSGPIFMLGTVGSAVFHDMRIGAVILAAHYCAALLNGFIFRLGKRTDPAPSRAPVARLSVEQYDDLMAKTISNSTLNMLYVGGYIVLCGMLIDTLPLVKFDAAIIGACGQEVGDAILSLSYGLIEMTRGCVAAANCANLRAATAICAGIVSFGGLSVTMQNYTFLSRCKMKFAQVVLRKFCHALIAAGLAYLFSLAL